MAKHLWNGSLKCNGRYNQVTQIPEHTNLSEDLGEDRTMEFGVLTERLRHLNRQKWAQTQAWNTPHVIDSNKTESLVFAHLSRNRRSIIVAKLKLGGLPLKVEIGCWKDDPIEHMLCRVCEKGFLEDESCYTLYCSACVKPKLRCFGCF